MSTQASSPIVADRPPGDGRDRRRSSIAIPAVLVIIGLLVVLYPVVATQWNNAKQLRAAQEYSKLEGDLPAEQLDRAVESARRYNADRATGPILDPWLARVSEDNAEYRAYQAELSAQEAMGRIVVPAAGADLPVFHGTSDAVLQRGAGHLFGTDLPVGGESTHSVITAHTGLSNATLFDNLKKVEAGDVFYVAVSGEKLKYEVETVDVVLPHETDGLAVQQNRDLMTLVTCTPYGINTHRLLVTGHRVAMDPADEAAFGDTGLGWQWWMWAILAAAAAIVAALIVWARRTMRAQARTEELR
ncbi:class C sortase [Corynebacterium sp. NPDC060344]|uniref:class C sortase n=1 Tax=Corynebacterium sp. NPDC060344 TaxID=3347101 RepID=UPI00365C4DF6